MVLYLGQSHYTWSRIYNRSEAVTYIAPVITTHWNGSYVGEYYCSTAIQIKGIATGLHTVTCSGS